MNIGQVNTCKVAKIVDFGVYLDAEALGEILLPKRYVPEGSEVGNELDVFIYLDSEQRLIATTETPKVEVGQCAYLKVVEVNKVGAFLDWGLPKDLLVPFAEQSTRMVEGEYYVVHVYLDERTGSIAASNRLDRYLHELNFYYKTHDSVDLLIASKTDLGYKAVINNTHLGLLYHSEVFKPINIGDQTSGYIHQIREDRMIDLTLRPSPKQENDELMEAIIAYLKQNDGCSPLSDKSDPKDIYKVFGVSKARYKSALGRLYKQKKISLSKTAVRIL